MAPILKTVYQVKWHPTGSPADFKRMWEIIAPAPAPAPAVYFGVWRKSLTRKLDSWFPNNLVFTHAKGFDDISFKFAMIINTKRNLIKRDWLTRTIIILFSPITLVPVIENNKSGQVVKFFLLWTLSFISGGRTY